MLNERSEAASKLLLNRLVNFTRGRDPRLAQTVYRHTDGPCLHVLRNWSSFHTFVCCEHGRLGLARKSGYSLQTFSVQALASDGEYALT
jgi:hypothetical protein